MNTITHNGKTIRSRGNFLIKVKPSPKERLILKEIERHGFFVRYLMGYFSQYKEYRNTKLASAYAFTHFHHPNMIVISVATYTRHRRGHSLLEILLHELAHVISVAGTSSEAGELNAYTESHGIKFCQTYTELCNKYKIRNPDEEYYLSGSL